MGNALEEVTAASSQGVAIDVVPVRYSYRSEVFFDRMISPAIARPEERVRPRLVLESTGPAKGRILFRHNGHSSIWIRTRQSSGRR